jgi:hypothetical protein
MSSNETAQAIWWSGTPRLARYVNGVRGGYGEPFNAMKLEITHSGKESNIESNQVGTAGDSLITIYRRVPTKITFSADAATKAMIAMAMLGSLGSFSQAAASAAPKTVTLIKDEWVDLEMMNLSAVTSAGLTPGVDFVIEPRLGLVKALTQAAAGEKTLAVTAGAVSGSKIIPGVDTILKCAIMMEVEESSSGKIGLLKIPTISVIPSKALEMVSAKESALEFSGTVNLTPFANALGEQEYKLYDFYPELVFA